MKCAQVRDNIAARRAEWLSSRDAAALDAHLAVCESCRAQMDADAKLCDALSELEAPEVYVPAWAHVRSVHTTQVPVRRGVWMVPALGSVAVAAGVLWIALGQIGRGPSPGDLADDTLDRTAREAHMMLAVSDLSSDPNRAVAMWVGDMEGRHDGSRGR